MDALFCTSDQSEDLKQFNEGQGSFTMLSSTLSTRLVSWPRRPLEGAMRSRLRRRLAYTLQTSIYQYIYRSIVTSVDLLYVNIWLATADISDLRKLDDPFPWLFYRNIIYYTLLIHWDFFINNPARNSMFFFCYQSSVGTVYIALYIVFGVFYFYFTLHCHRISTRYLWLIKGFCWFMTD